MTLEDIPRLVFLALTLLVLVRVLARLWDVRRLEMAARHSPRASQFLRVTLYLLAILAFDKLFWTLVIVLPYVLPAGITRSYGYGLALAGVNVVGQLALIVVLGRWWQATVSGLPAVKVYDGDKKEQEK